MRVGVDRRTGSPLSTASRSSRSGGSSRSGRQLISTATPCSAAGGEHRARRRTPTPGGRGRPRRIRPVQCPSTSTCGLRDRGRPSARSSAGAASAAWSARWRRPRRAGRAARRSWSSEPSSRMSTSMPVRMRNGASSSLSSADQRRAAPRSRSADSPLATVSRGEWSVSAIHSWPSVAGRLGHLPDRAAAVGPVRVRVAVAAQRRAHGRGRGGFRGFRQQPGQVVRLLAGRGLGDDLGGGLADPVQRAQRAVAQAALQFTRGQFADDLRGPAEGPHPVGGRARPLQHERDLAQRLYRVHAAIQPDRPAWVDEAPRGGQGE